MPFITQRRIITPAELAIVKGWSTPNPVEWGCLGCQGFVALGIGAAIGALLGIIIALAFFNTDPSFALQLRVFSIVTLIGGMAGVGYMMYQTSRMRQAYSAFSNITNDNLVDVTQYQVSDIAKVEIDESEEDLYGGYLCQIDETLVLFISELDLDEAIADSGQFPCDHFEIVRLVDDAKPVISITCTGTPMSPSHVLILDQATQEIPQQTCHLTGSLTNIPQLLMSH